MDTINEYLISKANSNKKDQIIIDNGFWSGAVYSYKTLNYEVEKRIELIKETYIFEKNYCFQVVDNTAEDIITFLALRRMNMRPILINENKVYDLLLEYDQKPVSTKHEFVVMPIERPDETIREFLDQIFINITPDIYDNDNQYHMPKFKLISEEMCNYALNGYLRYNRKAYETLEREDYDFGIPTSGTTGQNKIVPIKEKDLISRIIKDYDINEEMHYVGTTPISAISGIIFSLYLPIIGNNITVNNSLNDLLTDNNENNITMLVPGNYAGNKIDVATYTRTRPFIPSDPQKREKFNQKVKRIILLGEKTNSNVINKFIQGKDEELNNRIWNYYGRTENLGVVSKINIKEMESIYLYYKEIYNDKILYSPNKKDVYELTYKDNVRQSKLSNLAYRDEDFYEVLPIALTNSEEEDVKIKEKIFNEIIAQGIETGDYGFELNEKIYYLCRKNELLLQGDKYFYVTGLEEKINEQMNKKKLISRFNNTIEQKCFCILNNNNNLNIYIPCRVNYSLPNNFSRYFEFYKDFKQLIPKEIKVDEIILMDRSNVPKGKEIGKIKRKKFLEYNTEKYNNLMKYDTFDFITVMENKLYNYVVDYKDENFIFYKKATSFDDILYIASKYQIHDFREDKNYYYVVFDDSFLFATEANSQEYEKTREKNKFSDIADLIYYETPIDEFDEFQVSKYKLRNIILKRNHIAGYSNNKVTIYKEEDSLTATLTQIYDIDHPEFYNRRVYTIDDPLYEENKIIFEKELERSKYYEAKYGDKNYEIEYKIDNDNNFYLNDIPFDLSTYEDTIFGDMYKILLKVKDKEKGEKGRCKTLI